MIILASTPSMIWGTFIGLVIAFAIPMIFVAYGGMYSEHSGIVNIALEGIMVIGAMTSVMVCRQMSSAVTAGSIKPWFAMFDCHFGRGIGWSFILVAPFFCRQPPQSRSNHRGNCNEHHGSGHLPHWRNRDECRSRNRLDQLPSLDEVLAQ
jgi:hypothetical protein